MNCRTNATHNRKSNRYTGFCAKSLCLNLFSVTLCLRGELSIIEPQRHKDTVKRTSGKGRYTLTTRYALSLSSFG